MDAKGIPPMDLNGYADPYVVLKFGDKILRGPIVKKTLSPVWNHEFRMFVFPDQTK